MNINPFWMVCILGGEGGRGHRNFRFKASKLVLLDNPHLSFAFESVLKILGDTAVAQQLNLSNAFLFFLPWCYTDFILLRQMNDSSCLQKVLIQEFV